MKMLNIVGTCVSCEKYFDLTTDFRGFQARRCPACLEALNFRGKYGSVLVAARLTQRELAIAKREFYRAEKILKNLEGQKNAFMQQAMAEINKMVSEVEKQLGSTVADLQKMRNQTAAQLQTYMEQSGQTEMVVKNILLKLQEEVINRGNRPLFSQIIDQLGRLLELSEKELHEIVKANYSLPQYANILRVEHLPPGARRRKKTEKQSAGLDGAAPPQEMRANPRTLAFRVEDMELPTLAVIQSEFLKRGKEFCRIDGPEDVFILTGDLIRQNGLAEMINRQSETKRSLKVSNIEQNEDSTFVLIEGTYVQDPNTLRSFLAERVRGQNISGFEVVTPNKVAVEMKITAQDAHNVAFQFFNQLSNILNDLLHIQKQKSQFAQMISTGASQADTPDADVGDFALQWERNQPASGAPGSFGSGAQEGIQGPEKNSDNVGRITACVKCNGNLLTTLEKYTGSCVYCSE